MIIPGELLIDKSSAEMVVRMLKILKKFRVILNKRQKIKVLLIALMMIVGAALETIGVSLIIPIITTILDPTIIETNQLAKAFCSLFGIQTANAFMIVVIVALILVYVLKNLFLFIQYYVQCRFIYNNRFATQRRFMSIFLNRPYEYYLHATNAEISRIINSDITAVFHLLSTVLGFFTELVVSMALIITIIAVDSVMAAFVAAIMGVLMVIIIKIIKPILRKSGTEVQKNGVEQGKWLGQALIGIKEVKVNNKEEFFAKQYEKYGGKLIRAERKNRMLSQLPRLLIETVSVCSMLLFVAIMLITGKEVDVMIPRLSAFALAALRLLPSVNRMTTDLNSMSYYEPMLDKVIESLRGIDEEQTKADDIKINIFEDFNGDTSECDIRLFDKAVLSNITYKYPKTEKIILENANMEIPVSTAVGVIGASGSGKTTTVDLLLGLLKSENGEVLVDGININKNYTAWLSRVGYIPQQIFMLHANIRENVAFGSNPEDIDDDRVWQALEDAHLKEFVEELPNKIYSQIGEAGKRVSGGQRQRLGIARALYRDPDILIFDEATSSLDNETESAIMESINALHGKKTMIIIAHRLQTIEKCDIVYKVENGKILRER